MNHDPVLDECVNTRSTELETNLRARGLVANREGGEGGEEIYDQDKNYNKQK